METLELTQGSDEWCAARRHYLCASEAAAMLGLSTKVKRNELLHMKKTGTDREFSDWVQKNLLDKGHAVEALARPIAEAIVGDDLFPATGVSTIDGLPLLASYDGIKMDDSDNWEHKLLNQNIVATIQSGEVPDENWPQLEQQMIVANSERVLFMTSDGTEANEFHIWYTSRPERRAQVLAGWKQFVKDLDAYVPEAPVAAPVAAPIVQLPALLLEIEGRVVTSNLAVFRQRATEFIDQINTDLQTDQHFADAELTIKFCKDGEDRLELTKSQALAQTSTIDELFRTIDTISNELRTKRLELDRLVKARKEAIRVEILNGAQAAFDRHIRELNGVLGHSYMPTIPVDFVGAMRAKKTVSSLRNGVDTELARAKMAADEVFTRIHGNIKLLAELADGYPMLMRHEAQLVMKQPDDLVAQVKSWIAEHNQAEQKRLEDERSRIRAEEQAKAEREARERLDRERAEQLTADRLAREQQNTLATQPAAVVTPVTFPGVIKTLERVQSTAIPPNLRLGQIGERLGFAVTAEFLRTLGIEPVTKERGATLYHEHDFPRICVALVNHINSVCQLQAA